MLKEIREIPDRAHACYQHNKEKILPARVPYLGMGSSFYAAMTLKYNGLPVVCETASDYAMYLHRETKPLAVLISQSGESSEVLWNRNQVESYIAITNEPESSLASGKSCSQVIELFAGAEAGSATKTYVNTLVTLYLGHRLDPLPAIESIASSMEAYERWAGVTASGIVRELQKHPRKGIVVLGNGVNLATAHQVALILSESIHIPVGAMSVAQFDHGPKEAIANSILLVINSDGPEQDRTQTLLQVVKQHGGNAHVWQETALPHFLSPITACVPFFFLAAFLASELGITNSFSIGGKVTRFRDNQ